MTGFQTLEEKTKSILEEHRQIHFYLDQVEVTLGELGAGLPDSEPMRRLAAQIEGLRERLVEHHQAEETGGLFQAILEIMPERRVEISRLINEHEKIIEVLEMARIYAQCGAADDVDSLRVDLRNFLEMFRSHERAEDHLLQEAINRESEKHGLVRPGRTVLNGIFVFLVLASLLLASWSGRMDLLNAAILKSAKGAVEIALGLIGAMALFLGLMRVVQEAGLMRQIARAVAPVTRRLFPGVPEDHPAMSAMIMNVSCNFLGLGNAATPFGIKAMEELDRLNTQKGTATNAMVLFLAINTAGFAILPTSAIAIRVSLDSGDPTGILFPTWVTSGCAMLAGVTAAWLLAKLPAFRASEPQTVAADSTDQEGESSQPIAPLRRWAAVGAVVVGLAYMVFAIRHVVTHSASTPAFDLFREILSYWMLPPIVAGCVAYGWVRGVRVYDALVEGAKEGFQVAIRIIPYLVAILVAVGMFRASGGIAILVDALSGVTTRIGMPAEALPMALLRPLTGSGAQGVMTEVMSVHGPDSLIGYMVSTFQGSTETTFYVLAVYFGAIGVRRTRHTIPACLIADATGILAAVFIVNLLFG